MNISFQQNDSGCQNIESNYKFNIRLPFPGVCAKNEDEELIFRCLFKPESGGLWAFNKFNEEYKLFHQMSFNDILNQNNQEFAQNLIKHQ